MSSSQTRDAGSVDVRPGQLWRYRASDDSYWIELVLAVDVSRNTIRYVTIYPDGRIETEDHFRLGTFRVLYRIGSYELLVNA